jgi:hypothetical protein
MAKHIIDIDRLTETQLHDLNRRVVERLRFLNAMRAHKQMLEFSVGDQVCFEPPDRSMLKGTLVRYNRKTVTVLTVDGQQWNVAPGLLRKVASASSAQPEPGRTEAKVIALKP